jgi:hypothetical protein
LGSTNVGLAGGAQEYELTHQVCLGRSSGIFEKIESTFQDVQTKDTHLGIFIADLSTDRFPAGTMVHFTFYWPEEARWEKIDYSVIVE